MRSAFVFLLIVGFLTMAEIVGEQNSSAQSQSKTQEPQSQTQERPQRKDFGSSLKRLRWDPEKGTAVETRKPDDRTGGQSDGEVVRVETNLVVCVSRRATDPAGLWRD